MGDTLLQEIAVDRIRDKIAIGAGGALGLGAASARLLAREGAKVVNASPSITRSKGAF